MDYEGKHFPDPENVEFPPSKTGKVIKRVFKILFYSVMLSIFGILIYRFYTSADSGIIDQMIFSEKARETAGSNSEFEVVKIFPPEFMNPNGNIQLKHIYYSKTAGELEVGIRYNNKITNNSSDPKLYYQIKDSNGKVYQTVSIARDVRFNYVFERVSFGEIDLNLPLNTVNRPKEIKDDLSKLLEQGFNFDTANSDSTEDIPEEERLLRGTVYTLYIYSSADAIKNIMFSTEIYHNNIPYSDEKYSPPSDKYLSDKYLTKDR